MERRTEVCLVARFSLACGTLSCRKTKLLVDERYKIAMGFPFEMRQKVAKKNRCRAFADRPTMVGTCNGVASFIVVIRIVAAAEIRLNRWQKEYGG